MISKTVEPYTIDAVRKQFPNSNLSNEKIMQIVNWLDSYLGHKHIAVDNKLLKVLMDYEDRKDEIPPK